MNTKNTASLDDVQAIQQLIDEMFLAISCDANRQSDWDAFRSPCIDGAAMIPSARPPNPTGIDAFIDMMRGQMSDGSIKTFLERTVGHHVRVFGNIAVAMSAYEAVINDGPPNRGVNAFLLVKDTSWQIAAVAWDSESPENQIPDCLVLPDSLGAQK